MRIENKSRKRILEMHVLVGEVLKPSKRRNVILEKIQIFSVLPLSKISNISGQKIVRPTG